MNGMNSEGSIAALDHYVAPGLRLWMLIALVSGILLVMVVIVCCFMRIRIPRTKRQIDLIAARRKMRKSRVPSGSPPQGHHPPVMALMPTRQSHEKIHDEFQPLVHKSRTTTTV